jgi:TPR repeat protein
MRDWEKKQKEYEERMARVKELKLRLTCTICGEKAKLKCPCETTQYCSVACQKIDWRERGHRKACKKIRDERAAEAARAEAPTPPPQEVFYGPAPRSHADEIRARIAAEHEAARARREANPEPEPTSARYGSRCPICLEEWDVNVVNAIRVCCCRRICISCNLKAEVGPCPICRAPYPKCDKEDLALVRRHVENDVPEAVTFLGNVYRLGDLERPFPRDRETLNCQLTHFIGRLGVVKSAKKAAKIYKRAVELGNAEAALRLAELYAAGDGVKKDQNKALQLWRTAADRGYAHAQIKLALLLEDKGSPDEETFRLVELAAKQGLIEAEYNVGFRYYNGRGVTQDLEEAKRWFGRAAAKGDEKAIDALERLRAWERENPATGVET